MKNLYIALLVMPLFFSTIIVAQVYPPQTQLVFDQMPTIPKPGYLNPITDPTFGSTVVRITDQAVFNTHQNNLDTYHHYAKTQPWNSDGTLIKLQGWPSGILNGQTNQFIKTVWPPGGHHTWSNTQPNIIYGTNNPNYDGNCIAQLDVTTNTQTLIHCFNEYDFVSHGEYEGNMSNDDRYMALQCRKPGGAMEIACFDFVTNTKISTLPAPVWPNNVTMTQSGNYVIVQWNVTGTGPAQGVWAYNTSDMSPVRNLSRLGGSHFDYGYDTQGNEVMVGPSGIDRRVSMVRIDNGAVTHLLGDNQMSWYIHVSCRNLNRPGWAYLTEFADANTQTFKPNYQKIFAVQLDPNANQNALTETFAHVHHSPHVNYNRSPFGVPNRDGSKVMFRSDWMGNSSSEINSYVTYMPGGPTCNLSCSATQTSAPSCGNNNGQATANPSGGTAPFTYQWSANANGQTTSTANGLAPGNYTVNITDAANCTTSCNVTLTAVNGPTCAATQTTAPTCGNNNGAATATAQGGTAPYTYQWSSGQTTATANGLSAGTYTVIITDANNCSTTCTVTLVNSNTGGNVGAFANVPTQSSVAWNAGNSNINRPKPQLGVWQAGDIPGTEIMRVSDDSGNGLHFYGSRQVWNVDMTKMMIGNGIVAENKILDVTNNYALLPTRIPLNSDRVWSNTNPDLIYGIRARQELVEFNVTTGVATVLFTRGTDITMRSKGNIPGDDSKIALYESSTGRIISYDLKNRAIIAEMVWTNGNIAAGGNYLTYDWSGNWLLVGIGTGAGSRTLWRMNPNLTGITQISSNIEHWDMAVSTAGESVQVQTRGNGSLRIINVDNPSKTYNSPVFGGSAGGGWTPDYISGRGIPGWAAFGGHAGAGSPNHPLGLYKIDGNTGTATIKVIGFDHHSTADANSPGGNDDRQKPSASPDGNQVIFTSDWGVPNGPLSAYIIRGIGGGGGSCSPTCTAKQTIAPTCGNNNGEAKVVATDGTPPYTYLWSNGQMTTTAVALNAGTYTITVTDSNNQTTTCSVTLTGSGIPTCTIAVTSVPSCGGNDGEATVTAQGGTPPFSYLWSDGQTTNAANGLSAGTYSITVTDGNGCTTMCSITLTANSGGAFGSVSSQSSVAWNAGNSNANRPKPALGVWEPGDVPGTEIMRISDASGDGLHHYSSRQAWNSDMTKVMVGNGVPAANKLLDATNNFALLPTRVPLNSERIWSNTNPDIIYGMTGNNFSSFNVSTGVVTTLYTRPGNTNISFRYKGNLPGDDSKIALYEPSTNTIISYDMQNNTVIAEIVWPHGNINAGGNYLTFDWSGNWIIVGVGIFDGGPSELYRVSPDLTNITLISDNGEGWDLAYNAAGENVFVRTLGDGTVQVTNLDQIGNSYTSPVFGGGNPGQTFRSPDYLSGRGQMGAPGWIAFGGEANAGSPNHPLGLYKIDENATTATIKVIGYDHHSNAQAASPYGHVDRQVPTVSPDGNQVMFTSDWGIPNGPLSSYVIRGVGGGSPCAPITCNVSLWLEGAFNSGIMDNTLQQLSLLPMGQPYNRAPWNYSGNEGVGWLPSDYPSGSIDWILLSLRETDQGNSLAGKGAGLLMEDGSIQNATIELTRPAVSAYYIVAEHRNHLPVMTPMPVQLINNSLTYDFRTGNSYTQGGFGQKQIGSEWLLYAGNIDQSNPVGFEITGADLILWQAANGNFLQYMDEDTTMDGDVNGQDRILQNSNNGISSAVKK